MPNAGPEPGRDGVGHPATATPRAKSKPASRGAFGSPGGLRRRSLLCGAVALAAVAMVAAGGLDVLNLLARQGSAAEAAFAVMLAGVGVLTGLALWARRGPAQRTIRWLDRVSPTADAFHAFMLALPDAVVIVDRSLTINFANRAAEELYGYEVGTLTGTNIRNLMTPKARSADERALRDTMADGNVGRIVRGLERTALRKDGREVTIEINAQSYAALDGPMLVTIVRNVTQRRADERALRRSRENLEVAQRLARVGSFERNLVTNEIEWTDEFLRIWGLSSRPEDHGIEHVTSLVHPDDRKTFIAVREEAIAGKIVSPPDFRVIRPDGTERIFHNEYKVELDERGRPARLHGTVQDITERKKTEIELRTSRENLARAQRLAGIGSFVHDLVTDRAEWSDELYRLYGLSPEQGGGNIDLVLRYVHPDDREAFQGGIREQVTKGLQTSSLDFRITRADGVERVLHRECDLSFDESGKPARMFGTIQDVTARKEIELELLRSRESLARAQRLAGVGSFQRHVVTGEVEFSEELYRIHGLAPGDPEITLDKLRLLVHPEDRKRVQDFRRNAEAGLAMPPIDYRIVRPDGVERVLHRECDVLADSTGKPIYLFGTLQDVTERKTIETELRRNRENLARAQHLAGIGSFERDLISGETEFSEEFKRIWGIEEVPSDANRDFLLTFVHPADRDKFLEIRDSALKDRPPPWSDFRIVRPDGEERILHPEFRVNFDGAGKPIHFYGTVQDITQRKKIDEELRHSRENLARAHQVAGIGSFERDLVTGKLEWSDEFLKIWGIAQRPTHGSAELLLSLVHPDDRAKFMEGRDAALGRRSNLPLDFRIIRPDGEERFLHREYGVMFDSDGKPTRMFGTVQDVTERKGAELEIQRSRENLARAQRIAAMGSFERNFITGKAEWSDEMYRIVGIEKQEVRPGPELLMKYIHPEDRQKFVAYRVAERQEQPTQPLEYRIIRPDGQERIVRRESVVVFDDEKRAVRMFGTLQDITEQRLAERRERELERQLLHSHKLEALGTLAGGIAHDLNNTLVPIMALSKLTARRFEPGSLVRRNLETIHEASERARDLVKRVVAFTRKDESEKRETDLAETIVEALKLLRATIPSTINFEEKIEAVPPIPADASQIHQVVTNLVTNAFQALGDVAGTIAVSLGIVPDAGRRGEIRLSVSDTGMGMDEATQQRIFEPFFTTKPVGQGTGLGLSIVHGIVSSHGGRIEIKSAPGKGTRFDLFFPLPAEGDATSSRPAA